MPIYKGVHISDIHFGAVDNDKLNDEIKNGFLKYIDENINEIDYITINGDLLDRKINLNESYSKSSMNFINILVQYIKNTNFKLKIRLVKGTKTHDFTQLDNFKYLEKEFFNNFRIINVFERETLFDNFDVVYLPEEYMENQDEYYKELTDKLKNKPCDCIFGHGTWDLCSFVGNLSEKEIKGSPIYSYNEWKDLVNGFIIFGHIHVMHNFHNKLYYTGSYSRWIFGEEEDKGFLISEYNTDTNEYKVDFIKNELANTYKTFLLSKFVNEDTSIEGAIKNIEKLKSNYYKTRIIMDCELSKDNEEILKESFSSSEEIKLDSKTKIKEKEIDDRFKFLDDNNSVIKNISLFIETVNNKKLSEDRIIELLSDENS